MSRTYRRRGERHEYRWVLCDWARPTHFPVRVWIDPRSREGKRALARFHSDKEVTMGGAAPRWYRRAYDHRLRTKNESEFRRWLADLGYDPVIEVRHRHCANWSWW